MKIKYLFPALLLALGLAGCGEDYSAAGWTASDMAHVIAGETAEVLSAVTGGLYDEYLLDYYRLDPETIEDGAVLAAGGASPLPSSPPLKSSAAGASWSSRAARKTSCCRRKAPA